MAEYQYRCPACRHLFITNSRTVIPPCPICGHDNATRQYVFHTQNSMPEHMNVSTGQYVSNVRELKDTLARMSDEQSERLNLEHQYEYLTPAEMRDPTAHGVTEEGLP